MREHQVDQRPDAPGVVEVEARPEPVSTVPPRLVVAADGLAEGLGRLGRRQRGPERGDVLDAVEAGPDGRVGVDQLQVGRDRDAPLVGRVAGDPDQLHRQAVVDLDRRRPLRHVARHGGAGLVGRADRHGVVRVGVRLLVEVLPGQEAPRHRPAAVADRVVVADREAGVAQGRDASGEDEGGHLGRVVADVVVEVGVDEAGQDRQPGGVEDARPGGDGGRGAGPGRGDVRAAEDDHRVGDRGVPASVDQGGADDRRDLAGIGVGGRIDLPQTGEASARPRHRPTRRPGCRRGSPGPQSI